MNGVTGWGNCFINGLYLWCRLGFRGVPVIRFRPGTFIPHLMIKQKNCMWHFRVEKNFLPSPCHVFVFKGIYEKIG